MTEKPPPGARQIRELPGSVFARRLRQERENAGVSQVELSRRITELLGSPIDPSAITRIERHSRAIRLDEAVLAAEALDLPLSALLSDDAARELSTKIQQHLDELARAEAAWGEAMAEVKRLTSVIQALSADRDLFEKHTRG